MFMRCERLDTPVKWSLASRWLDQIRSKDAAIQKGGEEEDHSEESGYLHLSE